MSNAAQTWAWQQEGLLSSDKLVLVALADNAWEDGSNAWPSVALLCRKTSLCRRTVQTALRRLAESGRIVEHAPAAPDRARPTTYRLLMQPCAESAPPSATVAPPPAQELRDPRASAAQDPAHLTTDPRAAVAPEPSTNQVQEQPKELSAAKRRSKIPSPFFLNAELRAWAADKCPDIDVNAETEQFVDHHRGKGTLGLDWVATWRTWMRNAQKWHRGNRPRTAQVGYTDADRDRPAAMMTGNEWAEGA